MIKAIALGATVSMAVAALADASFGWIVTWGIIGGTTGWGAARAILSWIMRG